MPVIQKIYHENLIKLLREKTYVLDEALKSRPLKNSREGLTGTKEWKYPEKMIATAETSLNIRIAINDLNGILKEIGKLK